MDLRLLTRLSLLALIASATGAAAATATPAPAPTPAAQSFVIRRASLWGGAERDGLFAAAIDSQGVALMGGCARGYRPPGVTVRALADKSWGESDVGCVLRYQTRAHEMLEMVTLGPEITRIKLDAADNVYLFSPWNRGNTIIKTDRRLQKVIWSYSEGAGVDFDVTPEGEVFLIRKNTITRLNIDGTVAKRWDTIAEGASLAVCAKNKLVFACGCHAQTNLFWPWVIAYDFDGVKKYEMWNWTPKDAWKGGSADSFVTRMRVYDGKLYLLGTSDGNPTTLESSPQHAGAPLPESATKSPFPTADPASSREVGWFGTANAADGTIIAERRLYAPANLPRPTKEDPNRKKWQAGTTRSLDIAVDDNGGVVVVGFARGRLPWTADSKHREVGPPTWQGKWGNSEVPKDPFLIALPPAQESFAYCGSFAQGGSEWPEGEFTSVAARGGVICAVGWFGKPGAPLDEGTANNNRKRPQWRNGPPQSLLDNPPDAPAAACAYLENAYQTQWGGSNDGYFVILGGPAPDPRQSLLALLDEVDPAVKDDLAALRGAAPGKYAEPLATLRARIAAKAPEDAAKLADLERGAQVVEQAAERAVARARDLETSDPRSARAAWQDTVTRWAGLPAAATASARLAALATDDAFKQALAAQALGLDVDTALQALTVPANGQERTWLDLGYQKANAAAFRTAQGKLGELQRKFPQSPFAARAKAAAQGVGLPATAEEEACTRVFATMIEAEQRLKQPRGAKSASSKDPEYANANGDLLRTIREGYLRMQKEWPDQPATARARAVATKYGLIE